MLRKPDRLASQYAQRQIAASVHSSRNTISEVIKLADKINLRWPLDDQLTNEKVYALLYPNKLEAVNPRKEPDYNCKFRSIGAWISLEPV